MKRIVYKGSFKLLMNGFLIELLKTSSKGEILGVAEELIRKLMNYLSVHYLPFKI